jgi:LysM repeat protein
VIFIIFANFRLHRAYHLPIFDAMKRYIPLSALFLVLCTAFLRAEDPVALAERQEAEERYKRMNATLEELQASVLAQQQTIVRLTEELRNTREDLNRVISSSKDAATQESIKKLAEAIEKVDEKRLADNKNVTTRFNEAMREIQKTLANRPLPRVPTEPTPPIGKQEPTTKTNTPPPTEAGYEYTIRSGDTLSGLVAKLNRDGHKVTQTQLKEANPTVNWNKLIVGRKLFIPKTQ